MSGGSSPSDGPQTMKSWLAGMMSRRFWHDDVSEGDTLPEHCGRPSGFKTKMSRFRSLPLESVSITTYRKEFSCSSADVYNSPILRAFPP